MKKLLGTTLISAGLLCSLSAFAQDTTVVTPGSDIIIDPEPTVIVDQDPTVYDYPATTYPTTGWDPSALLALSGGLAAGSVALKGYLRRRS